MRPYVITVQFEDSVPVLVRGKALQPVEPRLRVRLVSVGERHERQDDHNRAQNAHTDLRHAPLHYDPAGNGGDEYAHGQHHPADELNLRHLQDV